MSEKHLTEPPWKPLVARLGVKDIGFQKALAAYARIDASKEPARALDRLAEISELAVKLKKTCAAKAEVVDHLNEVVKEVKKTTPALESRIKATLEAGKPAVATKAKDEDEDEDEEKEAAKFKKDL